MRKFFHPCAKSTAIAVIALSTALTPVLPSPGAAQERLVASRELVFAEFAIGVYKMEEGAVLEAVDHLEFAWRMSAHNVEIGQRLAEGYYTLKSLTRCEMVIDEILDVQPDDYDALLLKAKVRYIKRDPQAAAASLEHIRDAHGPSFEPQRLLGNIYYELGEAKKAIAAYESCIAIDRSNPYIYLRYGRLLADVGRSDDAAAAFKKAMDIDPGFSEPAMDLAELYLSAGHTTEALALLESIVTHNTTNVEALVRAATVYFETGQYEQGIEMLEHRREQAPLPGEAELMLGRMYYETGKYGQAFTVFADLYQDNGKTPELARILGEVSLKRGDVDMSRKYFEEAIALAPDEYRNYLGLFFAASDEFSTAETVIPLTDDERSAIVEKAGETVPEYDFDGNYMVGIAFLAINSLDRAEEHLLRARKVKDDDRSTLLNLANLRERRGDLDAAREVLAKLFELYPGDPTICNFYGYVLAGLKSDLDFAEKLVRRALENEPENGYYLDSLGWIYYQKGEYARAIVELERANTEVPDDPTILEHLGDALSALDRFTEARAAYERSSRFGGGDGLIQKLQTTSGAE